MDDDYYALLGVEKDATTQDIKRAFREIARKCHPDVSGGDAAAEEKFKAARLAYETLMDPVARARYDRRAQRKAQGGGAPAPGGTFFDAFWKASERATGEAPRVRSAGVRSSGRKSGGNEASLDDLVDSFGGFGASGAGAPGRAPPPERSSGFGFDDGPGGGRSDREEEAVRQGDDVHVELEVGGDIARTGGAVTAVYYRLVRSDSWRPGSTDPGLVRVQDIAHVRVIPGTRDGTVLRERGLGNAGPYGGPFGDLLCAVRLVAAPPPRKSWETPPPADARAAGPQSRSEARSAPPPPRVEPPRPDQSFRAESARAEAPRVEPPPAPPPDGDVDALLDITVVEALLGGRVQVDTPQGRIRATIPPCTSSGVRMRLKGKGRPGPDGAPADWFVVTRIVVPGALDAESRRLIEEFARLNP